MAEVDEGEVKRKPAILDHSSLNAAAMPVVNGEFAEGHHITAMLICIELGKLFHLNGQLDELWAWQGISRSLWQRYFKTAVIRANANSQSGHNLEAQSELNYVLQVLQQCKELGIFSDIGYRRQVECNRMQKSTDCSLSLAGLCWRRYMLGRALLQSDAALSLQRFESSHCLILQAHCRRRLVSKMLSAFPAAFRRWREQKEYLSWPAQRQAAGNYVAGMIRRKMLERRLAAVKATMETMQITNIDLNSLTPAMHRTLQDQYNSKICIDVLSENTNPQIAASKAGRTLSLSNEILHFLVIPFPRRICVGPGSSPSPASSGRRFSWVDLEGRFPNSDVGSDFRKRTVDDDVKEQIVGIDVIPEVGMRVVFRKAALEEFPQLIDDSAGGAGTISWVDPEDLDGDGVTGDICTVVWDMTGTKDDYRTGYEGEFRLSLVEEYRKRAESMTTAEKVVGVDVVPQVGMRVVLRKAALEEFPQLIEDSAGGAGTIIWVNPEDLDGDGVTGDICTVVWDKTGTKDDYRTGYEGEFRLALVGELRQRASGMTEGEQVVGVDVVPQVGMRVVLRKAALEEFPQLIEDSGGGAGTIIWVDPEDLDGDGVTGDICTVVWDSTGTKDDYRTGYEGVFRLATVAQAAPQFLFSPRTSAAGLTIQRVFRGFGARRKLRNELICRFIISEEMKAAEIYLSSTLRIQCAMRIHIAKKKLKFHSLLNVVTRQQQLVVAVESPIRVLLRIQSAFRGHFVRMELKVFLMTLRIINTAHERVLSNRILEPDRGLRHRRIVKCRWRLRFWSHLRSRAKQLGHISDNITEKHYQNIQSRIISRWKDHHEIVIDQSECVQRIVHCFAVAFFRHQIQLPFFAWSHHAGSKSWIRSKSVSARQLERKTLAAMMRWMLYVMLDFVHLSRKQIELSLIFRMKPLYRLSRIVVEEWHITTHRRRDVKAISKLMLPLWLSFLRYRCFQALKNSTLQGDIASCSATISMLKLQAKLGEFSKVSAAALQRFSTEQELNRTKKRLSISKPTNEPDKSRLAEALATNDKLFIKLKTAKARELLAEMSDLDDDTDKLSVLNGGPRPRKKGGKAAKKAARVPGFWEERSKTILRERSLWQGEEDAFTLRRCQSSDDAAGAAAGNHAQLEQEPALSRTLPKIGSGGGHGAMQPPDALRGLPGLRGLRRVSSAGDGARRPGKGRRLAPLDASEDLLAAGRGVAPAWRGRRV